MLLNHHGRNFATMDSNYLLGVTSTDLSDSMSFAYAGKRFAASRLALESTCRNLLLSPQKSLREKASLGKLGVLGKLFVEDLEVSKRQFTNVSRPNSVSYRMEQSWQSYLSESLRFCL